MKFLKVIAITLVTATAAFCQQPLDSHGENFVIVVDTLSLLMLLLTAYFAYELYKMMRGGQLAKSWGFISVAIITFAFGKLAEVGWKGEFWVIPDWFSNVINLFVAIFLALGVFSQRKTLA